MPPVPPTPFLPTRLGSIRSAVDADESLLLATEPIFDTSLDESEWGGAIEVTSTSAGPNLPNTRGPVLLMPAIPQSPTPRDLESINATETETPRPVRQITPDRTLNLDEYLGQDETVILEGTPAPTLETSQSDGESISTLETQRRVEGGMKRDGSSGILGRELSLSKKSKSRSPRKDDYFSRRLSTSLSRSSSTLNLASPALPTLKLPLSNSSDLDRPHISPRPRSREPSGSSTTSMTSSTSTNSNTMLPSSLIPRPLPRKSTVLGQSEFLGRHAQASGHVNVQLHQNEPVAGPSRIPRPSTQPARQSALSRYLAKSAVLHPTTQPPSQKLDESNILVAPRQSTARSRSADSDAMSESAPRSLNPEDHPADKTSVKEPTLIDLTSTPISEDIYTTSPPLRSGHTGEEREICPIQDAAPDIRRSLSNSSPLDSSTSSCSSEHRIQTHPQAQSRNASLEVGNTGYAPPAFTAEPVRATHAALSPRPDSAHSDTVEARKAESADDGDILHASTGSSSSTHSAQSSSVVLPSTPLSPSLPLELDQTSGSQCEEKTRKQKQTRRESASEKVLGFFAGLLRPSTPQAGLTERHSGITTELVDQGDLSIPGAFHQSPAANAGEASGNAAEVDVGTKDLSENQLSRGHSTRHLPPYTRSAAMGGSATSSSSYRTQTSTTPIYQPGFIPITRPSSRAFGTATASRALQPARIISATSGPILRTAINKPKVNAQGRPQPYPTSRPRVANGQSAFTSAAIARLPPPGQGASSAASKTQVKPLERARDINVTRAIFDPRPTGLKDVVPMAKTVPVSGHTPGKASRARMEQRAAFDRAVKEKIDEKERVRAEEERKKADEEERRYRESRKETVVWAKPVPEALYGKRKGQGVVG